MASQQSIIQLIGFHPQTKQLFLTEQGKTFLQNINDPLSIITIAGSYRTGKSYLVNQIIKRIYKDPEIKISNKFNKKQNFIVGNSIQSCTKGLNVYGVPFQSSYKNSKNQNKKFYYIIIDSEGIGSIEQQINYDINLLMMIFLLSSTVIYNSMGAIDEQSLDQLRVIINLKNCLDKSSQKTQPKLVWVLRDFALQLINKKGQAMSSNQYLEDCLEEVNSKNKQIIKKNQIRKAIKENLPNRQCHTLIRPTISQDLLNNLNNLDQNKIREQFTIQINNLYQSIFRKTSNDIKYINNSSNIMTGPLLLQFIEFSLNEINQNRTPEISQIWKLIESTKWQQSLQECENQVKRQCLKIDLPLPLQELKNKLNQIQNQIFLQYQKKLIISQADVKSYKKFQKQFIKVTKKVNDKIKKANSQIRKKKLLKQVRDTINKQIDFEDIDPCQVIGIKYTIQKLNLKVKGEIDIYEYVIQTIFDVLQISHQKILKMKKQLQQFKCIASEGDQSSRMKQQQIIKLKQNYHDTLKQISSLKNSQMDNEKAFMITKQQFTMVETKYKNLMMQKGQKQDQLRRIIDQIQEKYRRKNQDSNLTIKKLRNENQQLTNQMEIIKKQLEDKRQQYRKQVIFQQKIQYNWDRFQSQRSYLKSELEKYKNLYLEIDEKNKQVSEKYQKTVIQLKKQKQLIQKKQTQFCSQLRWMKQNYSKTKLAYNQSMNTIIQNEKILQDITQFGPKRKNNNFFSDNSNLQNKDISKSSTKRLSYQKNGDTNNKQYESLKLQKQTLDKQITNLNKKIQSFPKTIESIKKQYQQKIQNLSAKNQMLEQNFQNEKNKFYQCLHDLEQTKLNERKMYQDSIMRLLNNIGYQKNH